MQATVLYGGGDLRSETGRRRVSGGYRAMNDLQAIKTMITFA